MLGTAQSELGSFELGASLQFDQVVEPELQPQRDPRSTKRKLADLDERDPATVDPLIEELLREKPAQPLTIRDPALNPNEPQVVFVKGRDRVVTVVKTVVVQTPQRVIIRNRVKRVRPKSRVMALSVPAKLAMPQPVAIQPQRSVSPTWFWISLAIVGGILLGIVIANRSKPPTQSGVKLRRSARAIRQQS